MRSFSLLRLAALLATPAVARLPLSDAPPAPPPRPTSVTVDRSVTPNGPPDVRGELTDNDPMQDGKPYSAFSFDAEAEYEVTVTMTAQDFDTYVIVRSPTGEGWENDDFGDTRTSQVSFSAPSRGTSTIWATAFSTGGRGAFEVFVSTAAATVVSTASGRLDYQDEQLVKGEYFDVVTLRPPSRGEFFLDLMPLGFSGYLRVITMDEQQAPSQSLRSH